MPINAAKICGDIEKPAKSDAKTPSNGGSSDSRSIAGPMMLMDAISMNRLCTAGRFLISTAITTQIEKANNVVRLPKAARGDSGGPRATSWRSAKP